MQHTQPVGLVGIGLMGEAFAQRLLAAGFAVRGFDVDPAKRAHLVGLGGEAAESLEAVACAAQPIILAVFNTEQVEETTERVAAACPARVIVLCTSTCDPDRIAVLAGRFGNIRFVETPVSGTSQQVLHGNGVGLIGGDAHAAAEVGPVLDAIYPTRFHVGAAGDAGRTKLAINLILGLNRLALAEGLIFAERLGLDGQAFLDVARRSAAYSQIMDVKGETMLARDFAPKGRARQTLKDVHLMLDQAERRGQRLPLLEVHAQVLEACVRAGEGELDNSVVIEEIRRRHKVRV
jgi:3-hydroxyisobutyrate dehydrogenase-like beta-hydroxyacid dehydrogenase